MKKVLFFALIVLFGAASLGLAANAPNVGNATQKGSVLIFPKIDMSGEKDTLISISNDYYLPVNVKCFWVDDQQNVADFQFVLTQNQPIMFSARSGLDGGAAPLEVTVPPFEITDLTNFDSAVGELKCFAVDAAGSSQINFNHLYGTAKVVDYELGTAFEYNSWNFAARSGALGLPVGDPGNVKLNGVEFDSCPQYLLFNFNSVGSNYGFFKDTDLTIVPCKQDLRQDRNATRTKIKFDIWNENETKYTGAYQCFKCWFEGFLSEISPKFSFRSLHTTAGRFRAQGVASTSAVCGFTALPTPLIGLSSELLDFGFSDSISERVDYAVSGTTANAAGIDPTGFILWDIQNPGGVVPESAGR